MLLKTSKQDDSVTYDNLHIGRTSELCLFTTEMTFPQDAPNSFGSIKVTFTRPSDSPNKSITIPLEPDTTSLSTVHINMHQSGTSAYAMPAEYCYFFTSCLGFDVVLAYLGEHRRPVLGNLAPNATIRNRQRRDEAANEKSSASWFSTIRSSLPTVLGVSAGPGKEDEADYSITFADCSPYLIVSAASLVNISSRLPNGQKMDVTKFRPNIVVNGAAEAFEEDYWRELAITTASHDSPIMVKLTSNCVRCKSINVDYATGDFNSGPAVLKEMQKDRRIDTGHKYAPVFGRYGFLTSKSVEGMYLSVGDEVEVVERNDAHTVFRWPGLGQNPKTELYPVV